MKKYLLTFNTSKTSNLIRDLSDELISVLTKGVSIDELESFSREVIQRNDAHFHLILFLIKNAYLILKYQKDESNIIELTSPFLVNFLAQEPNYENHSPVENLDLHSDALILKEGILTKIINPYTRSSLQFSGSLPHFMSFLSNDPVFFELTKATQLFSHGQHQEKINPFLVDDFFFLKTHEEQTHSYNIDELRTMLENNPYALRGHPIDWQNVESIGFTDIILKRKSLRLPSPNLTLDSLTRLVSLIFSPSPDQKRIYPAAGAIDDLYPIIHLYDESFGIKRGSYQFKKNAGINKDALVYVGQLSFPLHHSQERPRCCVSLISNQTIVKYKYGPLSLKLSLLNAGVLLSYFYLFSTLLELNGSAYGERGTLESTLPDENKDLAGFLLY